MSDDALHHRAGPARRDPSWRSATSRWSAARQAAPRSPRRPTSRSTCSPGEFVCLLGPERQRQDLDPERARRPGGSRAAGRPCSTGNRSTGPGPDRAVLFQEPALFPWLSVRGNVELALEFDRSRDRGTARAHQPLARQRPPRAVGGCATARALGRACVSALPSRVRWRPTPTCCSATSRSGRSTLRRASCSKTRSSAYGSSRRVARRSCSSRTTCARRWCSPTGSS